jgi:hypothetical protein
VDDQPQTGPESVPGEQPAADAALPVPAPESFLRADPLPSNRHRPDPWAHRRAEPRPFALMWTGYLLLSTVACLGPITAAMFLTPEVYRPAAALLLVVTALGITIFWPMVRLSQEMPAGRPSSAVALDMIAVFFPLQATIWPQIIPALSDWDAPIALAVSFHCTAWLALTGAVLTAALGHVGRLEARGERAPTARTLWTVVFLALSLGASLLTLLLSRPTLHGSVPSGSTLWAAAPGIFEITRDRAWLGRAAAVQPEHWRFALGVLLIAAGLWALVLFFEKIALRDRPVNPAAPVH